jgi:CubicO group peptidase (beta-lactamase class C family)
VLDGQSPANTAAVRVDIVPGAQTRYSGGGTTIVQLMMVDRLKKPFPDIMAEAVLRPIGMSDSTYEQPLPERLARRAASGTLASGKTVEGRWHIYPEMAAAGLWTTAADLARVAIEVSKSKAGESSRVLSQAMTRQMLTRQSESFGIGFALGDAADQFGHNGADEGFQAYLTAFADSGRGVVIMANSDNGFMIFERLAGGIAKEYGWTSLETRNPPLFVKVSLLAKLKGVDHALAWYQTTRREAPANDVQPWILNRLGYQLLGDDKVTDAVKVFEANVGIYPQDANAYDSLAEGYMKAGRKDEAIANYRKSLELDPKNANAVKMLAKLGVQQPSR